MCLCVCAYVCTLCVFLSSVYLHVFVFCVLEWRLGEMVDNEK